MLCCQKCGSVNQIQQKSFIGEKTPRTHCNPSNKSRNVIDRTHAFSDDACRYMFKKSELTIQGLNLPVAMVA